MSALLYPEHSEYLLSDFDNEEIFRSEIVPELFAGKPRYAQPVVVFSGGQPGIGKTSARETMTAQFGDSNDFAVVSVDDLREKHPAYRRLRAANDRIAYQQVYDDASIWMRKVIDYAKDYGYNVIIDSTMIQPEVTARTALGFHDRGYTTAAAIVAGHESRSRQQILGRYLGKRLRNEGRYVDKADHDRAYSGVLITAGVIDEDKVFDHVGVFEPSGGPMIYRNSLDENGEWRAPAGTVAAMRSVRDRRRTGGEVTDFFRKIRSFLRWELTDGRPALEPCNRFRFSVIFLTKGADSSLDRRRVCRQRRGRGRVMS